MLTTAEPYNSQNANPTQAEQEERRKLEALVRQMRKDASPATRQRLSRTPSTQ
jgi:hypothetical protein